MCTSTLDLIDGDAAVDYSATEAYRGFFGFVQSTENDPFALRTDLAYNHTL